MCGVGSRSMMRENTKKLDSWYDRATVRTAPRRMLNEEEIEGKQFFSPELISTLHHSFITAADPELRREMIIQHLYHYLDFTSQLEHRVVNIVAADIALGRSDVKLSTVLRLEAHQLCVDETYHALFSDDMVAQITWATGVEMFDQSSAAFLDELLKIEADLDPDIRGLVKPLFAVCSETLISGTLNKVPKDPRVITSVRELIADHADDEARHHNYFSNYFKFLWPQLSAHQRDLLGPKLANFITIFLQPNTWWIPTVVNKFGISAKDAEQLIHESYTREKLAADQRAIASATLRLFKNTGVFENPAIRDSFQEKLLIE